MKKFWCFPKKINLLGQKQLDFHRVMRIIGPSSKKYQLTDTAQMIFKMQKTSLSEKIFNSYLEEWIEEDSEEEKKRSGVPTESSLKDKKSTYDEKI